MRRSGVRLPMAPPAFARSAAESEGCRAGASAQRRARLSNLRGLRLAVTHLADNGAVQLFHFYFANVSAAAFQRSCSRGSNVITSNDLRTNSRAVRNESNSPIAMA